MVFNNSIKRFWENTKTFKNQEWIPEWKDITYQERAFLCLKHFVKKESLWNGLNILEIWPMPTSDSYIDKKRSSISLFQEKLPNNTYLWVWGHEKNEKETKIIMWKVPFVGWLIDSRYKELWINIALNHFNWNPDIIYWRQVFENSSTGSDNSIFPLWRPNMLNWSIELLKDWWYIIIDNAWGEFSWVLNWDWLYAKHLKLVKIYYYWDDEWIFIYQKPVGTNKLVEEELKWIQNQKIELQLKIRKTKVTSILNHLSSQKEWIEKKIKLITEKIDWINSQIWNINLKWIPKKDEIIEKLNSQIEWLNFKLSELKKRLLNVINDINKNKKV